jgi:KDO2-lipid IV(A) lauroyltransferase
MSADTARAGAAGRDHRGPGKRAGPLKQLRWLAEAAATWTWLRGMGALSPERASDLGGWLGRTLGPRLAVDRTARANVALAFPDLDAARIRDIVRASWDNLGRTAAEYPHLDRIMDPASGRVSYAGADRLRAAVDAGQAVICWSGHFANWEVLGCAAAQLAPRSVAVVRDPNNPYVARMIERCRAVAGGERVNKGREASRRMMAAVRERAVLAVLLDQRLSDGIDARLFGHPAKSPSGAALMAVRRQVAMYPVRIERLGPARFRVSVEDPFAPPQDGDRESCARALVDACNARLEAWIRARPGEWLWQHRRFEKAIYRSAASAD